MLYHEIQPNVLVGVLHVDAVPVPWSLGLRRLRVPGAFQDPMMVTGMPFDMARNVCCMKALECGADYLFFLDSDVVPPADVIPRLIARGRPVISGVYARRSPPHGIPVMLRRGQWLTPAEVDPKLGVVEVDWVGAGCLLIAREVLERLPPLDPDTGKHWFSWRVDRKGGKLADYYCTSEDFAFCTAVKEQLGVPVCVDTTIVCDHDGWATARPGYFAPAHPLPPAA